MIAPSAAFALLAVVLLTQCTSPEHVPAESDVSEAPSLAYDQEVHLANVRQLTFGGDNAEAYWAFNNDALVYQTTQP